MPRYGRTRHHMHAPHALPRYGHTRHHMHAPHAMPMRSGGGTGLFTHEYAKMAAVAWSPATLGLLTLSCVIGVAISFLGWRARSLVTATCVHPSLPTCPPAHLPTRPPASLPTRLLSAPVCPSAYRSTCLPADLPAALVTHGSLAGRDEPPRGRHAHAHGAHAHAHAHAHGATRAPCNSAEASLPPPRRCYTVLGVANKMLTVLANAMIWDQHASMVGILFLVVCLAGAAGYKQAPLAADVEGLPAPTATGGAGRKGSSRRLLVGGGLALTVGGFALAALALSSRALPTSLNAQQPPPSAPLALSRGGLTRRGAASRAAYGAAGGSSKGGSADVKNVKDGSIGELLGGSRQSQLHPASSVGHRSERKPEHRHKEAPKIVAKHATGTKPAPITPSAS